MILWPIMNQGIYPGAGAPPWDDCAIVASLWAARASGYTGSLPTVTAFRKAAGVPDKPGPAGLLNAQVMAGIMGTALASLRPVAWKGPWAPFAAAVKGGAIASAAVWSAALPKEFRYGFMGAHRVGLAYRDRWYIANPLGPDHSAPLPIDEQDVFTALMAYGIGRVIAITFPPLEDNPVLTVTDPTQRLVDIAIGVQLYDLNGAPIQRVGVVQRDIPAFTAGEYRAVIVPIERERRLVLVKANEVTNVRTVVADVKHGIAITVDGRSIWEGTI